MAKFKVQITETLQRIEEVEAPDFAEAIEKISDKYRNGEIVLTADNSVVESDIQLYEA